MTGASQPGLIGARVKRVEDPRFLRGETSFLEDIVLPRTLHAAFVRSPHAHARIRGWDVSATLAHPGVAGIMTGPEAASLTTPIRADSTFESWQSAGIPILAHEKVRFVGEPVAIVVANSRYVAEDAAELVEMQYETLPPIVDTLAAAEPGAPLVHEAWADNYMIRRKLDVGDVEQAFRAADLVWKGTLKTQRHTAVPMEYRGSLAHYERGARRLTVYMATQIPHLIRTGLADAIGMPENQIRVVAPDVGGGFGIKAHLFPEDCAVALMAIKLGRPVKWVEDVSEHLSSCYHAREHIHQVEAAAKRDGTITALKARLYVDAGAYSVWPWTSTMDTGMALGILPGPYAIRNFSCEAYSIATNKAPLGPYRGVARPSAAFTIERIVDEVARELGLDPQEVRLRNFVREFPYVSATGLTYDSASLAEATQQALEVVDYPRLRQEQARLRQEGRYLGIGVAAYIEQTAHTTKEFVKRGVPIIFGYDTVNVRIDPSGTVTALPSCHSHGQGLETTLAQVVAERLGVPLADVRVIFGDTQSVPYGMGTFASRSAVLCGGAAWKAATALRDKVLRIAGHMLETSPSDLELRDGAIRVKGAPGRGLTLAQLARQAYHRPETLPPGMAPADLELTVNYDADPGTGTFTNATHLTVVEVSPMTGRVEILRYVVVEDCGVMINPLIVDGQVQGGTAQGIGGALYEHLVYDDQGQILTTTFMDYLLPAATEVPPIEVFHRETPSPFTIGGFKGMGEGGAIAPGPCLANAVSDALAPLGATFYELPLTPERVLNAIRSAGLSAQV